MSYTDLGVDEKEKYEDNFDKAYDKLVNGEWQN